MGRLLDDLNRLNAAAAQGKVLLAADRRTPTGKVLAGAGASPVSMDGAASRGLSRCMQSAGVSKAQAIPRHTSCDFVGKHYEVIRDLGRGSFSRVQLVRERRTGHERVCKVVNTEQMTPEVLELTRAEIQVLATLDHPSIVRLYEYADDPSRHRLVLILEYIAGGDCSGLLEESGQQTLSEGRVARLVQQLLVATSCCHARSIVHRDIKPQNMMLTRSIGAWGMPDLKLIDFGLAAKMQTSRDFVGTPAYMPPEVLDGSVDYTSQADMWSIACTVLELLTGEPPFGKPEDFDGDMEPVFEQIRSFHSFDDVLPRLEELSGWAGRSGEAQDFVRRLLRVEPDRRMTAAQALNHPWMTKHAPPRTGLTADMVRSMADFAAAPSLLRCCLFFIAARTGITEQARIGLAFTDADADWNGSISRDELVDGMASASVCGWSPSDVDANAVFAATDLGRHGRLGFTAFAAACLFGRHGRSADKLAELAFAALDDDRDNYLWLVELQPLFGPEALERASEVLPQDRPFGVQEWRAFVRSEAAAGSASPRHGGALTDAVMSEDEEARGPLLRFFRAFVCEQLLCSGCEQLRDTNDDEREMTGEAPVVLCHNYDPNLELPVSHYKVADVPPRLGDMDGTAIDFEVVRSFHRRGGKV